MISFIRAIAIVVATTTIAWNVAAEEIEDKRQTCPLPSAGIQSPSDQMLIGENTFCKGDRMWLVSSRHLSCSTRRINLQDPKLSVYRVSERGTSQSESLEALEAQLTPSRPLVIYVHGNLIDRNKAICRGMFVYRTIRRRRTDEPVDWLIWSWPSSKDGIRWLRDFRVKAERTDSQGLYLAWFLRRQVNASLPITMIGYSFGARIISGSLHALAGGSLDGRQLDGPKVTGAPISAGMVAPALESTWMSAKGYHGRATKNLDHLLILYSRRDAILKRYWLIDRIRKNVALGYTGPRTFGSRADGSRLPVRSRDCASTIGKHHREIEYYQLRRCKADLEMAKLIDAQFSTPGI